MGADGLDILGQWEGRDASEVLEWWCERVGDGGTLEASTFTKLLSECPVGRSAIGELCAKGCLARRTTAHSGRPGAQPISSMVAFGPKEDVLLIGWAIWKLND